MNFHNVEFLISAAAPKDFPKTRLPEIAFAGKSNVGKSSVINRLLQRKLQLYCSCPLPPGSIPDGCWRQQPH